MPPSWSLYSLSLKKKKEKLFKTQKACGIKWHGRLGTGRAWRWRADNGRTGRHGSERPPQKLPLCPGRKHGAELRPALALPPSYEEATSLLNLKRKRKRKEEEKLKRKNMLYIIYKEQVGGCVYVCISLEPENPYMQRKKEEKNFGREELRKYLIGRRRAMGEAEGEGALQHSPAATCSLWHVATK